MDLDERLQPQVAGAGDEIGEAARRVQRGQQQDEVRSGGAQDGSCRASTTNSLASTGTATAARTARRSSTDPPNQWGSQRTEITLAPPAS